MALIQRLMMHSETIEDQHSPGKGTEKDSRVLFFLLLLLEIEPKVLCIHTSLPLNHSPNLREGIPSVYNSCLKSEPLKIFKWESDSKRFGVFKITLETFKMKIKSKR